MPAAVGDLVLDYDFTIASELAADISPAHAFEAAFRNAGIDGLRYSKIKKLPQEIKISAISAVITTAYSFLEFKAKHPYLSEAAMVARECFEKKGNYTIVTGDFQATCKAFGHTPDPNLENDRPQALFVAQLVDGLFGAKRKVFVAENAILSYPLNVLRLAKICPESVIGMAANLASRVHDYNLGLIPTTDRKAALIVGHRAHAAEAEFYLKHAAHLIQNGLLPEPSQRILNMYPKGFQTRGLPANIV